MRAALAGLLLAASLWGADAVSAASAPPQSVVAQARGRTVAVYRNPNAPRPFLRLASPNPEGSPLVFLVVSRRPGWDRVRLAVRPNGSTGWIRESAVTLALDPYRVDVSLAGHRITVTAGSRVVYRGKAGVGRTVLPTPRGTYYIVSLLRQPDPAGLYDPYAFGLSAFSDVLYSFGGGPGEIGLHGTDDPARLGTNVSHGCIRITNAAIEKPARLLPLGTPVRIS